MSKTFIGKPCRTCGNTERYFSGNKVCVSCAKRYSTKRAEEGKTKQWRDENKQRVNKCLTHEKS